MRYRKLGNTDIEVSVLCLGTMTFGQQNTEEEGHEQLNYALTQGINFVDTAEMYSVPGNEKTQGSTERIIGTWLKKYGRRNEIILASKVTGPSPAFAFLSPNLGFSRNRLLEAIDNNLTRLQTDYLDIYQLHWPERKSNFFSTLGYVHHPEDQWEDNFEEAISTLNELVKVGKIRHWGLSNETPWGMMRTCSVSDNLGLPRPISVQNPYNLLNRAYEVGMAEISIREKISLLVYSPMAFGLLSGKYHQKLDHPQDRLNQFKQMARYNNDLSYQATSK
jgi:aryl-alcohol dehydrogenase-like predicted oxidoreductase